MRVGFFLLLGGMGFVLFIDISLYTSLQNTEFLEQP